jgi:hypothetical protein
MRERYGCATFGAVSFQKLCVYNDPAIEITSPRNATADRKNAGYFLTSQGNLLC